MQYQGMHCNHLLEYAPAYSKIQQCHRRQNVSVDRDTQPDWIGNVIAVNKCKELTLQMKNGRSWDYTDS